MLEHEIMGLAERNHDFPSSTEWRMALPSIAVSLRRIADVLERHEGLLYMIGFEKGVRYE